MEPDKQMFSSDLVGNYVDRASAIPDFDFNKLPLSNNSRKQLSNIYYHVQKHEVIPGVKSGLLFKFIIPDAYNDRRGLYVPLTTDIFLKGKLPVHSIDVANINLKGRLRPLNVQFFTNTLAIPLNLYEVNNLDSLLAPKLRITNAGFLIITLEIDSKGREQLEEQLEWLRGTGKGFGNSRFASVDQALCAYGEYRGCCVVFAGNRSLHFHFVFSTKHLEACPFDDCREDRWSEDQPRQAAIMDRVHGEYWDAVKAIFCKLLRPSEEPDKALRAATQWRRMPWGVRTLDKASAILDLPAGTRVPQIVIAEDIRSRASPSANGFLIPEAFSTAAPLSKTRPSTDAVNSASNLVIIPTGISDINSMLKELAFLCDVEWGAYPKPVSIQRQGNGEWKINFRNSETDRNPSTIVSGGYRRLVLRGKNTFTKEFYLPDGMTAQDLCNHLALEFGQKPEASVVSEPLDEPADTRSSWERYKDRKKEPFYIAEGKRLSRSFNEPISDQSRDLRSIYRDKLHSTLMDARTYKIPLLVKSGEGVSKTSSLCQILTGDFYGGMPDGRSGTSYFVTFSFRSYEQAEKKAIEFRASGLNVIGISSFWNHLLEVCRSLEHSDLKRDDFASNELALVLKELLQNFPDVYYLLEERRKALWVEAQFDPNSTVLVMPHRIAELWNFTVSTRAWYHPDFDPDASQEDHRILKERFGLADLVIDDPEVDEFLDILTEAQYLFLIENKKVDWRNLSLDERRQLYYGCRKQAKDLQIYTFERFDSLMRFDLTQVNKIDVDFKKIPYGQDNPGIYQNTDGDRYYVGVKKWVFSLESTRLIFLTTETIVSEIIETIHRQRHDGDGNFRPKPLLSLQIDQLDGIYPIRVPVLLDDRANSTKIKSLVEELTSDDPNAVVIADGLGDMDGTITFQKMKGANGLEESNIYTIVTWLAPDHYGHLNIIGQFLGTNNIILMHYQDQINQAVGRNRGFRQSSKPTDSVVITTKKLWAKYIRALGEIFTANTPLSE